MTTRYNLLSRLKKLKSNFFETASFLLLRKTLVTWLIGNDPVIMNITVTSDIIVYNKLESNHRSLVIGNKVKTVSSRTSFVYNPSNTTYVN